MLGSLAECQEMQCLASQNLEGYEAVGKAFPVCNELDCSALSLICKVVYIPSSAAPTWALEGARPSRWRICAALQHRIDR